MSKQEWYRQCCFKKETKPHHYKTYVAWIPEKFAKMGKMLQLKFQDGSIEDGWKVTFVGGRELLDNLEKKSRDYLKQRDSSDM